MSGDRIAYVTAGLYWCLVLCWLIILIFYWREHRRFTHISSIVRSMVAVIFLDGARTLAESIYFGAIYTARTGLIPRYLSEALSQPQYVLIPKGLNLLAALTIIGVLMRNWFPDLRAEMERQRETERLYEELQQAHREIQDAHEARDALTHMIVHDMRTPLTNVITGLQTVQGIDDDPALASELVGNALTGADRLLVMVNDLLDISKMESGEMRVAPEVFSMRHVIADAEAMVDALAREGDLEIRQPAPEEDRPEGGMVFADRDLVRRILVNLLGNAIKYSPPGAAIIINIEPADGNILSAVSDSGPGIPAAHLERIFDKFYQVQHGNSGGVAATGLGLAFCRMAVEAQGGQIGVESTPGAGSRFWFTLPAASTDDR